MKKSVIIKISAAVIAISILLIAAGLLLRRPASTSTQVLTIQFVRGWDSGVSVSGSSAGSTKRQNRYVYSFKADFNDVCAAAHSELTTLGYVEEIIPGQQPRSRRYRLQGPRSGDSVNVTILDKHQLKIYSTPENSDYSSPDIFAYHYKDGFVSVEINQRQRQSWLRFQLKYWCYRLFP